MVQSAMGDAAEWLLALTRNTGHQAYTIAYAKASTITTEAVHSNLRWFLLDIPVVPVLLLFHTLFASMKVYDLTPARTFWLKSLTLTAFAAFGGSTVAAILSGRPAPLFTSASDIMGLYLLASWFVVQQSRTVRLLLNSRLGMAVLSFGANASRARAIFKFMDEYMERFPRCVSGAIVLGGLSGAGGRLFISLENIVQKGFATSSEFSAPGWAFKSSFVAAAAYYVLVDSHDVFYDLGFSPLVLDKSLARFYISTTLCFHAALEVLVDRQFNPLYVFERVLYALTGLREGVKTDVREHLLERTLSDSTVDVPEAHGVDDSAHSPVSDRPNAPGLRRRRRR